MLTVFDRASVQAYTAATIDAAERCHSGEGDKCAKLEGRLKQHAFRCRDFCDDVRQWMIAVFTDRAAFDPDTERLWREAGHHLVGHARGLSAEGRAALDRIPCYMLDWLDMLERSAADLERLLTDWVTPARAVGPGPRVRIAAGSATDVQIRERVTNLPTRPVPPPPADPADMARLFGVRPPC